MESVWLNILTQTLSIQWHSIQGNPVNITHSSMIENRLAAFFWPFFVYWGGGGGRNLINILHPFPPSSIFPNMHL